MSTSTRSIAGVRTTCSRRTTLTACASLLPMSRSWTRSRGQRGQATRQTLVRHAVQARTIVAVSAITAIPLQANVKRSNVGRIQRRVGVGAGTQRSQEAGSESAIAPCLKSANKEYAAVAHWFRPDVGLRAEFKTAPISRRSTPRKPDQRHARIVRNNPLDRSGARITSTALCPMPAALREWPCRKHTCNVMHRRSASSRASPTAAPAGARGRRRRPGPPRRARLRRRAPSRPCRAPAPSGRRTWRPPRSSSSD